MRRARLMTLVLALTVFASVLPVMDFAASAQEAGDAMPPLPRPRPDRDAVTDPAPSLDPVPSTPATEAITEVVAPLQPVTLTARITEDGTPIAEGLVWRIFDTTPDASGELALVAKSEEAAATLELRPGEYVVHVAFGRAQISDTLTVATGTNEKSFVLDAGALRLNSAITGDIPIPATLLKFDIFTGGSEASRTAVAEGVLPNEILTLNSGTYHVVAKFGEVNAVVRADLRVEAGQLTDATLYQQASQVSFRLVSEAGGEAIADVEWTVKTADGATVFSELGAFPATVLATGEYLVLAKQRDTVFNRQFEVQAGAAKEIEVLTSAH